MKKRNLPFLLLSFCFLCIMLGCMATIPVKSATTGLLIDKKEDMPKKVGLYCWTSDSYYIPNYSLKFIIKYPQIGETDYTFKIKLNEELKAGLIRLNFGVLGFQQIEQVLEKSLLDYMTIRQGPTLRLTSPEIAQLKEEDKKKLTEQLGLQTLFLGFGESAENPTRGYYSQGYITRIKMELIDIKTAKIIWSVDAYDRGMNEKAAFLNTAKQVLKLFEKDIKAFDK